MQSERIVELDNTKTYTIILKRAGGTNTKNISVHCQYNTNKVLEGTIVSPSNNGNIRTFTDSNGLYRSWLYIPAEATCNNLELEVMVLDGEYTFSNAPSFEKYGQCPSTQFKAEVEGICGDINLKVQNKNLIELGTLLKGFTDLQTGRIRLVDNSISYYFETRKLPNTITISGKNANRSNASYYNEIPKLDVQSEMWDPKNYMESSRTILVDKQYKYILIQFTYGQNATDIQVEEGTKVTAYAEHKEKNFVISLGNKKLYKGDKIVRQNGKWYFALKWKKVDDFSNAYKEPTNISGKSCIRLMLSDNFKITDTDNNVNSGYCNKLKLLKQGETFQCIDGFTVYNSSNSSVSTERRLWIYIDEFSSFTTQNQFVEALNESGMYFVLPLEEAELEEITDEVLISQLDKILMYLFEYDDITNFDFDSDVCFEITVEKDKLKILENRLDNAEQNTTNAEMLALESED